MTKKETNHVKSWVSDNIPNIEVRDYQIKAWVKLQGCRKKKRKRALVHLATGLGKTSVAAVEVGIGRHAARKHLMNSGFDTSRVKVYNKV